MAASFLNLAFKVAVNAGVVGIKSSLAYQRILSYDNVTKTDAERIFAKDLGNVSSQERKTFQDFTMNAVREKCG